MAQVPYNPVPAPAEPVTARGPEFNPPPEAFGVNIGRAITQFGQTTGQVGNELFQTAMQIQGLKNETTARETAIQATQKMALAQSEFDKLEGQASSDQLQAHLKNLNDIRTQFRQGLNPMAARMYDAEAANLQNRFTAASAARAGEGVKVAADRSAQASLKLATEEWVNPEDEGEANQKSKDIDSAVDLLKRTHNLTPDQVAATKLDAYSKAWYGRIETIGMTKPGVGFDLLNRAQASGEITSQDAARAQLFLRTQNRAIVGDALAEKIYNEGGTLDEMRAKAREQAPALAHGDDQEFLRHVYNGIEHNDYFVRREQEQQKRTDVGLVYSTIEQNHPLSESAFLESSPDAAAAYHRLRSQGMFPHGLGAMLTQRVSWDEDSLRQYSTLKAEAEVDPQAFLKRDIPSMALPNSAKISLINLQTQKAKDPSGNVPLMTTFHELRAIFPNTIPDPAVDKQGALEYQGALLEVMQQYMTEKKTNKIPYEDLKKIGQGLNATYAVPGWFGTRQEHIYELQPPSVVMDAMRASGKDDDSIIRDYRKARSQEVFNKLFAGSAKAPTATTRPLPFGGQVVPARNPGE